MLHLCMIDSIKHKGLRRLFERNDTSRLPANHLRKIRLVLGIMNRAQSLDDMKFPGSGFHPLTGNLAGYYAVRVSGNYRIVFRFEDGAFTNVDYIDYH